MGYDIGPYDPCPCGSGAKYKFCCAARNKANRHGKFPIGTVAYYGPDDKVTTKIVACVVRNDLDHNPILQRWVGTGVATDPKIADEVKRLFARHGVKSVVFTGGIIGCPHEEGADFPVGQDCPFCPFWAGKQGTARRDVTNEDDGDEDSVEGDEGDEDDAEAEDDENENVYGARDQGEPDGSLTTGKREYDRIFARIEAILADPDNLLDHREARDRLLDHLEANLSLPCEVRGSEDFRWEERYVIGGWPAAEYKRLKQSRPSYTDRFELLGIERDQPSQWQMCADDAGARVRRIRDGKQFVLGLSELKATDKKSPNYQLLDDYGTWFWNSR